jgi:hypothetical protein
MADRLASNGETMKASVVIDVGCCRYGGDYSVERLVAEFNPDTLYGYDPNGEASDYTEADTHVQIAKAAVWTHTGYCEYVTPGLGGFIRGDTGDTAMFDIKMLVTEAYERHGGPLVLKLDCEGSEYGILERLIETGADRLVEFAWVEWHGPDRAPYRKWIEDNWKGARMEEWLW